MITFISELRSVIEYLTPEFVLMLFNNALLLSYLNQWLWSQHNVPNPAYHEAVPVAAVTFDLSLMLFPVVVLLTGSCRHAVDLCVLNGDERR